MTVGYNLSNSKSLSKYGKQRQQGSLHVKIFGGNASEVQPLK